MEKFKCSTRFPLAAALLLVMSVTLASLAKETPKPAPGTAAPSASEYVGTDTCMTCHEDVYKEMQKTSHYKTLLESKGTPGSHGCEGCHGPGSEHVNGGGDVSKIVSFKTLTAKQSSERCLSCHSGAEHRNFSRSVHLSNDVGCTSCHSPHHAKEKQDLLVSSQPELCFQCHTEMRAEFNKPYRHRVNVGLIQCTDCHNEHGSATSKQLRTTVAQDQVCFKCHTEKQGPFVYEHLPVKTEGCQACHTPHGSTNPRLLRTSQVNILCLQCHTQTHNVASAAPIGPSKNQNARYQACILCHTAVHGSNTGSYLNQP